MDTTTPQWLEDRRQGLGGSDIAAIFGLSPWVGPIDVWKDKTGRSEPVAETPAMRRGRILENSLREVYAEENPGKAVVTYDSGPWGPGAFDRVIKGAEPWQLASLDGYVLARLDDENSERVGLWEGKTSRNREKWGGPGTAAIPIYYATQVAWYMPIASHHFGTQFNWCDITTYFPFTDEFVTYRIHRDLEVEEAMIERAGKWWEKHIVGDVPPPLDGTQAAQDMVHETYPLPEFQTLREAVDIEIGICTDLRSIRDQMKALAAKKKELETRLKSYIGLHPGLVGDFGKVTWKEEEGRKTIDTKRLRAEHPDLAKEFTKQSAPKRVLRSTYRG